MRLFSVIGYAALKVMINKEGSREIGFELAKNRLVGSKAYSEPTLDSYLGHIARFIEFMYAAFLVGWNKKVTVDHILNTYEEYLITPLTTSNDFAYKVAQKTGRTESCGIGSLGVIESALKAFFRVSSGILAEGVDDYIFTAYAQEVVIIDDISESRQLRASMKFTSFISDTPSKRKRRKNRFFSRTKIRKFGEPDPILDDQHFPFDKIEQLIYSGETSRDRAFYALLAAIGCREHEALQIRLKDIKFLKREIYLIDPHTRHCAGITEDEARRLNWKGRSTSQTFFLEPWGDIFWAEISSYMKNERIKEGRHDFLFQTLSGPNCGRPLFTSDRSSRNKAFHRHAANCGVTLTTGTAIHSLRHSYGVYALSYHPRRDGSMGFELATVAKMLGHSNIFNTKKYAKKDRSLIVADLQYARERMHMADRSQKQILISFHRQQLRLLQNDQPDQFD